MYIYVYIYVYMYIIHGDYIYNSPRFEFHGIYNTINDVHNQRQNYFTLFILNYFDIYFYVIQKIFL